MPYVILADKLGEFLRRELRDATVIGRAVDCDIVVRDILLSRHHCRLEPFNGRWVAVDMGSKNGSRIGQEPLTKHVLSDGDVIRMGKVQICFRDGPFVPAPQESKSRETRAEDPQEALAGTVMGFQYFDMEEDSKISGFPIPKPKPAEPKSYQQDDVHSIVTQMSSSSWDLALSEPDVEGGAPAKSKTKTPVKPAPPVLKRQKAIEQERAGTLNIFETPPPVVRDPSPDESATIPGWLAWMFVLASLAVGGASLWVLLGKLLPL